jgi:hypothetical protein
MGRRMKIKELLIDETKWTQNCNARDKDETPINPNSPEAVCFCLIGAIHVCYPDPQDHNDVYDKIQNQIRTKYLIPFISDWNDSSERTFEEVKEVIDKANV